MKFVEKAKKKLIEIKQKKISEIRERDIKLDGERVDESETIKQISNEIELLKKEKKDLEKDLLSKKTIDEYKTIIKFLIYFSNLSNILKKIDEAFDAYKKTNKMIFRAVNKRNNLNDTLKELNTFIKKIVEEIAVLHSSEIGEESIVQAYEQLSSLNKSDYYCILDDAYKNRTICINPSDQEKIRKIIVLFSPEFLSRIPKADAIKLNHAKKEYEPMELWSNIEEYNDLMKNVFFIIDRLLQVFQLKELDRNNSKLFDIRYLTEKIERAEIGAKRTEEIIREIREKRRELEKRRKKSKKAITKNGRKNSTGHSNNNKNKIEEVIEEIKTIEEAQTIQELGYDCKFDAAIELGIPTKDYIVIPVPKSIEKISQLFFTEKVLKVEIYGHMYYTTYMLNSAFGRINNAEQLDDKKAVVLIPLDDREDLNEEFKNSIVSANKGIIELNMQALKNKGTLLIISDDNEMSVESLDGIQVKRSSQNLIDELKKELGDDYTEELDVTDDYRIFNGIKTVSDIEAELMRKAVIDCIFENIANVVDDEKNDIYVNGERFFYTSSEKKEIRTRHNKGNLEDLKIEDIIENIEHFLQEDNRDVGVGVDILYGKLLQEYLKYNRKAKSDYYSEPDTMVNVGRKIISIKPPLAPSNSLIAKQYSRPNEDIAYKMMKLADLVNRFAHEYENAGNIELSERIYDLKKDLIERTIEYSRNNPNIKITTSKDERLNATYVALEIPGYNVIALHIINAKYSLRNSIKILKTTDIDIPTKSTIMNGGVNEEFLIELLNMPFMERVEIIRKLNNKTFNKLLLRMGYSLEELKNKEAKKELINRIMSDETITDLLSKQRSESEFGYR